VLWLMCEHSACIRGTVAFITAYMDTLIGMFFLKMMGKLKLRIEEQPHRWKLYSYFACPGVGVICTVCTALYCMAYAVSDVQSSKSDTGNYNVLFGL